ncbi:hypothetical protein B0T36_11295 [Nocardia donostiensis]|uniref:DUF3558 domain-containing protein n=1 Tax=Nocardia donostiensis TaxID=1538463 RepID=UPI0009DB5E3F|nr:DUF3558 domain-containing protein [Nocardia donostiensis]OQS15218.1 hypothetical protein B0T36_11295 [Nocardia donostiensis]
MMSGKTAGARRAVRAVALAVAGVAVAASAVGCGRTIEGSAQPVGAGETVNTEFDKLLRECEVVAMDKIAETVGADSINSSFNGAICMWDLGNGMVTLNWYEIGSLTNEKTNNDRLGYLTESVTVEGRRALQSRRPNDPHSCGVSASAADTGIIGWWVNYRPGGHKDPCEAAKKLVELTLNLAR